jgi:hypothetical protein
MRGKNLFSSSFKDGDAQSNKGRSRKNAKRRNECLADRYYYYGQYTDKRYNAIIEQLSLEFFLSKETVPDIIESQVEYLKELKKAKPGIYYFQNRWPHLKWNLMSR